MQSGRNRRSEWAKILVGVVVVLAAGCAGMGQPEKQRVATPNEQVVVRWLQDYEKAWNLHDTRRLQVLSNLDTAEMLAVQRIFDDRLNLEVRIDNVRTRELDGGVVQATYTRRDQWKDVSSGRVGSSSGSFEHNFRVTNGVARPFGLMRN